jgi:hypothetical protein
MNEIECGECPYKWRRKVRTLDIYGECRYIESGQKAEDFNKKEAEQEK